ncbi:hypothetical protein ACFOPQ_03935, partial [Deinococcus antarcticus]
MKRKAYPTDLTQKQFKRIEPLLPKAKPGGRPRSVDLYEVLCAIIRIPINFGIKATSGKGCTGKEG